MSEIDKAFEVVKNLSFERNSLKETPNSVDSILLMKEFLRRMLLWERQLKLEKKWPWFSVAQVLKPELVLEERYGSFVLNSGYPKWVKVTLIWYLLCFQHQAENTGKTSFNLPDPYEPLLLMYQNHIYFEREMNIIDIYDPFKKIGGFTLLRKDFDTDQAFIKIEK